MYIQTFIDIQESKSPWEKQKQKNFTLIIAIDDHPGYALNDSTKLYISTNETKYSNTNHYAIGYEK